MPKNSRFHLVLSDSEPPDSVFRSQIFRNFSAPFDFIRSNRIHDRHNSSTDSARAFGGKIKHGVKARRSEAAKAYLVIFFRVRSVQAYANRIDRLRKRADYVGQIPKAFVSFQNQFRLPVGIQPRFPALSTQKSADFHKRVESVKRLAEAAKHKFPIAVKLRFIQAMNNFFRRRLLVQPKIMTANAVRRTSHAKATAVATFIR
jgi:hypothetical protein